MKIGIAFNKTVQKYRLKAQVIADEAQANGSPGPISKSGSGFKAVDTDSLERFLMAIDDEAFEYFLRQLAGARKIRLSLKEEASLSELVGHLDDAETAKVLRAIAAKLRAGAQ